MKNRDEFMKIWKLQRSRGKFRYVITNAGSVGVFGLLGAVLGSVFFYGPPSEYSFSYYLPTYLKVFFGVVVIASIKLIYEWGKNEKKYGDYCMGHKN